MGVLSDRTVRLALGLEVFDAVRGDLADVEVAWEDVPTPLPVPRRSDLATLAGGTYDPGIGLPRLPRGQLPGRFRLAFTPDVTPVPPARVRVVDAQRRYVPRRLEVPFPTLAAVLAEEASGVRPRPRGRRVGVWPGAAFRAEGGTTGVRGRVVEGAGQPVRWARAEASHPDRGTPLGYAHGDDRGEFLLLLGTAPSTLDEPGGFTFSVRITVFARPVPVGPPPDGLTARPGDDPLADLVPEVLPPLGAPDDVSVGRVTSAGFTRTTSLTVPCVLGRMVIPATPFVLP